MNKPSLYRLLLSCFSTQNRRTDRRVAEVGARRVSSGAEDGDHLEAASSSPTAVPTPMGDAKHASAFDVLRAATPSSSGDATQGLKPDQFATLRPAKRVFEVRSPCRCACGVQGGVECRAGRFFGARIHVHGLHTYLTVCIQHVSPTVLLPARRSMQAHGAWWGTWES